MKPRPSLLDRLSWWWTFRDVRALDITVTGSGGRVFVEFPTRRWFKRCIVVEVTPDEARGLADQIRDMLDEPDPTPTGTVNATEENL